ncbi:MAG: S24 family peptidase [Lentisphaeria bacterium]|nr:S24 family peptidase [Lentisphaeria bacterium]
MKLTPEILEALSRAIDHYGNTAQFAKKIGVAHSTVLFWMSGKTRNISGSVWDSKVRRLLRPFMPVTIRDPRRPYLPPAPSEQGRVEEAPAAPLRLPSIGFSLMDKVDTTLQSPVTFARSRGTEETLLGEIAADSDFLLVLDRPDFCPELPLGSLLLVSCGNYAQDGDIVIVRTRHPAELFLCRCTRTDDRIRLTPLNPKFPAMEWQNQENAEKVFWIFPVRKILIDLDKHCWKDGALVPKENEAE